MPALPDELYNHLIDLCADHFRRVDDREAILLPSLSTWDGFARIEWEGNPRAFTARLIYQLPGDELKRVLRALVVGHAAQQAVDAACARIDTAVALKTAPQPAPLTAYYRETADLLAGPRRRRARGPRCDGLR